MATPADPPAASVVPTLNWSADWPAGVNAFFSAS